MEPLEAVGDSVLVVGDAVTLKIHVHCDEPDVVVGLFREAGEVSRLDVADMHAQVAERAARLDGEPRAEQATCGAIAVAAGSGMRALFEGLGIGVVDGGATLNPSTYELLAGIHSVAAEEVIVLPNSGNVIMAAERAAELSEKVVHVVPTTSQQAGLTISVEMERTRSAAENAEAMAAALARLRTGGVARAAREDPQGRFAIGDAVGFVDDALVAWGDPSATLRSVLASLGDGAELLTLIAGDGAPLDGDAVSRARPVRRRGRGLPRWPADRGGGSSPPSDGTRPRRPSDRGPGQTSSVRAFADTREPDPAELLAAPGALAAAAAPARAAGAAARQGPGGRRGAGPDHRRRAARPPARGAPARRGRSPSWSPTRSRPCSWRCAGSPAGRCAAAA